MYLERIEMTGFKSFADKTVIEFDRGLTAIVGPNGSGKSNLSEAIRWVLGEQSAKSLRGDRMEDIIFNGTQDRAPVNKATVTIVLNNEDRYLDYDFNEISITRSYNRNGDSRYMINNEQVRLRDIVDLFLDTGLGRNSFSMISQGQVEQIFLSKPEERRVIFEEVAGVQKYQYRKNEAERKLNRSKDHLDRVNDIIHELESQLAPLKKQKEKAERYQELTKELEAVEISHYVNQIDKNNQELEKLEEKIEKLTTKLTETNAKLIETTDNIEEDQNKWSKLLEKIDEVNTHQQNSLQQVERIKSQGQILEQQISFKEASKAQKAKSQAEQEEELEKLTEQINASELKKLELTKEIQEAKTELKELEQEFKLLTDTSSREVEELRDELIFAYQKEASYSNELKALEQAVEQAEQVLENTMEKEEELKDKIESLEKEQDEQLVKLEEQDKILQDYYKKLVSYDEEKRNLQENSQNLQQELIQTERNLARLQSKYQALQNMEEDYSGYYAGVRAVMQNKNRLSGIIGTVAELIKVKEEYQVAIDTALGASLQNVVVTDDKAARDAINYLKQQRSGRATFLPRANIKGRYLNDNYLQTAKTYPSFIGIADSLVEYDSSNRQLISNLLGSTIVMGNLKEAQDLSRSLNQRVKIVTLDGSLILPGGSITGGSRARSDSELLGRTKQLEEAKGAFEDARNYLNTTEEKYKNIQEKLFEINQKTSNIQDLYTTTKLNLDNLKQTNNQQEAELISYKKDLIIQEDEAKQASIKLEASTKQLEETTKQLEKIRSFIEEGQLTLERLNLSKDDREEQLELLRSSITDLKTKEAVNSSELRQVDERLTEQKQTKENIEQILEEFANEETVSKNDLDDLVRELEETKVALEKEEENSSSLKEKLEELRNLRTTLNDRIKVMQASEQELLEEKHNYEKEETRLNARLERLEELIDEALLYLNEEYQLNYEMALTKLEDVTVSYSLDKLRRLKQEIASLGTINLQAIEDYENVHERYVKLKDEEEDLLAAMSNLEETMEEMDQEVITRFGETFTEVNEKFQETFKSLFGGGQAKLVLTEPDDLLTTGIDIIAQPPGKRQQNLALLSGGERALTAIALLFAILETRPVPFVLLDEVEAALDEANVDRFGQYLKTFSENTQFIVVTHRQGTMAYADVLYGVTMQNSGVSKLASVRLSQAQELVE